MSRDLPAIPNLEHLKKQAKKRRPLFFSRYEAAQLGSVVIEPHHILPGVIRAGSTLMRRLFEPADLSLDGARAEMLSGRDTRALPPVPSSVEVPFSDGTKQILASAVEEAGRLSHRDIGMSHMLLGILRDERSVAASVLNRRGLHRGAIQKAAVDLAGEDRQP